MLGLLLSLLFNTQIFAVEKNTVSLYVTPAQKYLDFKSPKSMFYTFGVSYLKREAGGRIANLQKSGMGHVVARINCQDSQGTEHSFFTGISGQYSSQQDRMDIFEDKLGMGVLFRGYKDGYVQTSSYVRYLIGDHTGRLQRDGTGKIRRMSPQFMSFEITPKQCGDIVDYYQTFKDKSFGEPPSYDEYVTMKPNEPLFFNFVMDPYQIYLDIKKNNLEVSETKMGAVCSSFAVGLLKVAGIYDAIFEDLWPLNIQVGESLIGKPEQNFEVSILDIAKRTKWVKGSEKSRPLKFYHPEYMWSFFEGVKECLELGKRTKFCTPEVLSWTKKNQKRLSTEAQNIKFEKELRSGTTEKRVRNISGISLAL